jgi:hypothetical protein
MWRSMTRSIGFQPVPESGFQPTGVNRGRSDVTKQAYEPVGRPQVEDPSFTPS